MVLLYGNRKRLFSKWQVLTAAYQHTYFAMFAVQVYINSSSCMHYHHQRMSCMQPCSMKQPCARAAPFCLMILGNYAADCRFPCAPGYLCSATRSTKICESKDAQESCIAHQDPERISWLLQHAAVLKPPFASGLISDSCITRIRVITHLHRAIVTCKLTQQTCMEVIIATLVGAHSAKLCTLCSMWSCFT